MLFRSIRLTATIINAATGAYFASESVDATDGGLLQAQESLANFIVSVVRPIGGHATGWRGIVRPTENLAARVHQRLVDAIDSENDEAIARSPWDAPEIDGNVFLPGATNLKPGDKVRVRIVEAEEYDLVGELV